MVVRATPGAVAPSKGRADGIGALTVMLLLALHACMGLFIPKGSSIGTLHNAVVTLSGIWIAATNLSPVATLYTAAYSVGADGFWRLKEAGIVWEAGKLNLCVFFVIGMIRQKRFKATGAGLLYIFLMLPAALITIWTEPWFLGRGYLTMNLSGPISLAMSWAYCRGVRIDRQELLRILALMVLPAVSMGASVAKGIGSSNINWGERSNFTASGGLSPNQVSAVLSLGGLCVLMIFLLSDKTWWKIISSALCAWMIGQSALTFSRTGVYLFGAGAVAAGMFFMKDPLTRIKFLVGGVVLAALLYFVAIPTLDKITGGKIADRYASKSLTGRDKIASADLEIWYDNFVFGTGVGRGVTAREAHGMGGYNAHTEFTRLLAEHGVFGFSALLVLIYTLAVSLWHQKGVGFAVAVGFCVWALGFMTASAMRLSAPSFLLGILAAGLDIGGRAMAGPKQPRRRAGMPPARSGPPQRGRSPGHHGSDGRIAPQ